MEVNNVETKNIQIANFNCTFELEGKNLPMLDYFDTLLLPALRQPSFFRKSAGASFYFTEISLVNLSKDVSKPEIALVGKHVKRVELDIRNDYAPEKGFIHVGEVHPSAPFSSFVLLLRNHRLIHFGDQKGSPSIRSLAATIEKAIKKYKRNFLQSVIKQYDKEGVYPTTNLLGEISVVKFPRKSDLSKYLLNAVPRPEINIVPIPHPNVVEQKIKELSKIDKLSFNLFALNSELQVNDTLKNLQKISNQMGTERASGQFFNPTNIAKITNFVKESKGLADLKLNARIGENKITMGTDDFVETICVRVPAEIDLQVQGKIVYEELKHREEIQGASLENARRYENYWSKLSDQ